MSILITSRVWSSTKTTIPSHRLLLLAIADFADDNGEAWPSVGTLAARCCLSERSANRIIAGLCQSGELERRIGAGPKGTNVYRVLTCTGVVPAVDAPPPDTGDTPVAHVTPDTTDTLTPTSGGDDTGDRIPLTPMSPEPSLNRQELPHGSTASTVRLPPCPHSKLIDLFAERATTLPRPRKELWEGSQAAKDMQDRWRWVLTARRATGERYATHTDEALVWFGNFFDVVAASGFLSGRSGRWKGCNLQWLVKRANFTKVVEGHYEDTEREAA